MTKGAIKQQRGYTLITLTLLLGLIAFFTLLIVKIGPIYLNHFKVKSALDALEKTPNVQTLSEVDVRSTLDKRFNMNYVASLKAQDLKITKMGGYLKVEAHYEVEKELLGNLSVLVKFDDDFEVGHE